MVAYDVRIAAPDARILDYALLKSQAGTWAAFLSDGIAAFADLIERVGAAPGRWVVNNSWGLFDRLNDAPIGSPENYSANPDHPFNQITGSLVAAGADVFFAAGNCGADCPDARCGAGDTGPGASIHGANSHPDVITVAAVAVTDRRLGYSSQGRGALYSRKPDLAGFSHFVGSRIYPADAGTSAASPVAAGVAAALRQDRKSTRLNSSHRTISYAVFCLKKKKTKKIRIGRHQQLVVGERTAAVVGDHTHERVPLLLESARLIRLVDASSAIHQM